MKADAHIELELSIPVGTPETIDSAFLCHLTAAYLELLQRVAQEQGRELSFQGFRLAEGSTRAFVMPSDASVAQDAADEAAPYVSGELEAPVAVATHAREVSRVLREGVPRELAANVIIGTFRRPLSPRPEEERLLATEVVSLRCRIQRVGGTRPAVRVESASEDTPFTLLLVDPAIARKLGAHLYEEVDVVAKVRRDFEGKIFGGELMEWEPLEEGSGVDAWKEWFRRSCPEWEDVEDVNRELGRTDDD